MSYPGASAPPSGVVPDLDNPKDVLRTCLGVTQGLTVAFVTIFVFLRVYARLRVFKGVFTWDDCTTYAAYVVMVGYCITGFCAARYGGGLNQWEVPKNQIQHFLQAGYAATLFYAPMALLVKLSLVLIIVRVFGLVHRKTIIGVYVFVAIICLYYISGFFIKMLICRPISAYWRGESDKCLDQSAIITADAIISVISDLVILLLPVPLTWSLKLPLRKRLRVIGILCAGGIATGFSVYRLALIIRDGKSTNQTIVFTKVILSGNAEVGIGLICACFPSINALIVRCRKGTEYYANTRSSHGPFSDRTIGGGIMLTRTYVVYSMRNTKDVTDQDFELGNDQAKLVVSVQDKRTFYNETRGSASSQ